MGLGADEIDFSPLDQTDLMNLVLQRSDVLGYNRSAYDLVRQWEAGNAAPLSEAVAANGPSYAREAARLIGAEFKALGGLLGRLAPRRLADIGCGYAIFDLFVYHSLGCDLLLIDIEQTGDRHFGFMEQGAGYSSLATAVRFLTANGVPESRISTWNPNREDAPDGAPLDLAVSFLSCGFHYPVDMYMPFFRFAVAETGAVILDLRGAQAQAGIVQLETLGKVRVLDAAPGVKRVLLRKRPAP